MLKLVLLIVFIPCNIIAAITTNKRNPEFINLLKFQQPIIIHFALSFVYSHGWSLNQFIRIAQKWYLKEGR